MATVQVLASGKNAAASDDFEIMDGSVSNIFLKDVKNGVDGDAVFIEIKDDAGEYTILGTLGSSRMGVTIQGPGIFRVRRADGLRSSLGVSRA